MTNLEIYESELSKLRKEWRKAKMAGHKVGMAIIERQAANIQKEIDYLKS